jgi:CHAT domain-containing protein
MLLRVLLFFFFLLWADAPPTPLVAQCPEVLYEYGASVEQWQSGGNSDSTLHYLRGQLAAARTCDSLALWAYTLLDIEDALPPNSARALSDLDSALARCWRMPASAAEWEAWLYLSADRARHLFRTGRLLESLQAYQQADSLYSRWQFPEFDAVEYLYKPLGNHLTRLGDNEKALAVFQKALHLAQQSGADPDVSAGLYNNIGIAHWNNGDYAASGKALNKGLSLPAISAEKRALLSGALARTRLDAGDAPAALRLAGAALRFLPAVAEAPEQRFRLRATLGMACLAMQQPDDALTHLTLARTECQQVFGSARHREAGKIEIAVAAAWRQKKDPARAAAAADRALASVVPGEGAGTGHLPLPRQLYAENTIAEALRERARAACLYFEQTGRAAHADTALQCYDLIAQTHQLLREAYFYPSSKLHLQETARACDEEALEAACLLYQKSREPRWLRRALAIAERSKAAVLYETLRDNALLRRQATGDQRTEAIHRLRSSLAWTEREQLLSRDSTERAALALQSDALRSAIRPLEQSLRPALPFGETLVQEHPETGVMGSQESFLECFATATRLHLIYGNAEGPQGWRVVEADTVFRRDLQDMHRLLTQEDALLQRPRMFFEVAHRLYKNLLEGLPAPQGGWLIIPDGPLTALPFEVLLTQAPDTAMNLRAAPYLLRRHAVRYGWSLAILAHQMHLPAQGSGQLLAIAPGFASGQRGLAPLSASGKEWQAWPRHIAFPANQCTRTAVFEKARPAAILHFATHATGGQRPSLELWDETLFLPDLYALSLQADLVSLSACETGTGDQYAGEGAMSLARAFACAGAKSVLATGWKAGDAATETLFAAFYQYLAAGNSKSEALQKAKLDYLDHARPAAFCSPRFWAALILTGDNAAIHAHSPRRYGAWLAAGFVLVLLFLLQRYRKLRA